MGIDDRPDLSSLRSLLDSVPEDAPPITLTRQDFDQLALAVREGDESREVAIAVLRRADVDTPDAIPCLGQLLTHPDDEVRAFAARGLGGFGVSVSKRKG